MAADERTFEDAEGHVWEIRPESDFKWHFVPADDGDRDARIVTPPPEVDDPAGLGEATLRRLLRSGIPAEGIAGPSAGGDES